MAFKSITCTRCILLLAAFTSGMSVSNATKVNLIAGEADPFNVGPVPVPPNEPVPLNSTELAAITDSNFSTGYSFTSSQGSYSSDPDTVIGFGIRYDFDVSNYHTINEIVFTWTGLMTWDGTTFPDMRLGSDPTVPQIKLNFGTNSSPDNVVKTGTINFFDSANSFFDLNSVVNNGVASFWASTDLSISNKNIVDNLTIHTLEVSANVTGVLNPVPLPATVWLFGSGLIGLIGVTRRKEA